MNDYGWDDDFDSTDEWLAEQERLDRESILNSIKVFSIFFKFEPQIVLPAAPPENEEEEWEGLHLTAKVWYGLGE